jgi:hypothetical protein
MGNRFHIKIPGYQGNNRQFFAFDALSAQLQSSKDVTRQRLARKYL